MQDNDFKRKEIQFRFQLPHCVPDKVEDAAQAGIQIASSEMQFEYTIDSMVGNNSSMIF